MMYFGISETARAVVLFCLLGVCGAVACEGMRFAFLYAGSFFRVTAAAWRFSFRGDKSGAVRRLGAVRECRLGGVRRFFCEMLFTLLFGISFFLLLYYASDGVFRFYFLLSLLLSFGLARRVCAPLFRRAEAAILSFLSACLFYLLSICMFPFAVFLRLTAGYLLAPLVRLCGIFVAARRHARLSRSHLSAWKRDIGRMLG